MSQKKILLICLAILGAAALVTVLIYSTEPTAQREAATRQTAMLVETLPAEAGTFTPVLSATGTVRAVEDVQLSPLVNGQVIRRDPAFAPGGFVSEGDILLQIQPADFQNTLDLRESELLQARTELNVEMGRQKVAEQDLALVGGDSLSPEERELVLRKPQLQAVQARIKAAEAAVAQARLNLSRATIRAPFNAHILTQNVTVGSQVTPGDNLGRLVGTEAYWVELTVPVTQLRWLEFPHDGQEGARVEIRNRSVWDDNVMREGRLFQQVGALDAQTRLARVLVRVEDPLARDAEPGTPPLMIGSFVDCRIEGRPVENTVRISRDHLRTNQTVWVNEDGKLSVRDVTVVLTDMNHAYISEGLNGNEQVVTTNLSTVSDGIALRTEGGASADGEGNQPEAEEVSAAGDTPAAGASAPTTPQSD
ncbi:MULTISPECIES: efflux RND transporter periplasmic adaptor subunit [unclassified Robiginitalea]|uniref:efflux RND transporter periplasmic adaptor subunit n=1 Tax=Robiginitalea TaxID=252306 RepID=UPI00234B50E2|nr:MULTISPECIES: efflux RND transporter periplasmic adaptor subunit [unclassified Robiginitalea]MDC6353296.1 efflux RND transporter periplasmic adaptor subunit [Robiginitalea sp. PM2]MDC6373539.1 efflux RND transporter periplasmic adaptor subunit [Robiginitalea sp. SP8]